MQIDFRKLLDWAYLNRTPSADFLFFWPLLIIFAAALVLGIGLWVFKKLHPVPPHTQKFLRWLIVWSVFPVPLGAILVFARNQTLWPLNLRFFLLAFLFSWLLGFLVLAIYRATIYKKLAYQFWLKEEKLRYLPKTKKKK